MRSPHASFRCRYVRHSSFTLAPPLNGLSIPSATSGCPVALRSSAGLRSQCATGFTALGFVLPTMRPAGAVCHHRRMRPSVLIVDDHEDFRHSARTLLQAEGFAVVGEAGDGAEAIAKARAVRPDVVLVDIQLPDLDGFAVAEQIAAWPSPPVVVLISSRDAAVYRSRLASTPARGFIAK